MDTGAARPQQAAKKNQNHRNSGNPMEASQRVGSPCECRPDNKRYTHDRQKQVIGQEMVRQRKSRQHCDQKPRDTEADNSSRGAQQENHSKSERHQAEKAEKRHESLRQTPESALPGARHIESPAGGKV